MKWLMLTLGAGFNDPIPCISTWGSGKRPNTITNKTKWKKKRRASK